MATVENYTLPDDLYYDRENHLWVRVDDGRAVVGLDALGQASMGDVVYIQLEPEGTRVSRGDPIGSVEAAKMVSPLYAPISGTLVRHNEAVLRNPGLVNADPYGRGWLVELEPSRWQAEATALIHGADRVARWLEEEVARYRSQGWID